MEDPFAGRVRLNQLSPEELKFRNDRMSNQPQAKFEADLTDDDLNRISREYYASLTAARTEQQKQSATTTTSPGAVLSTPQESTPTNTTTATYELPYGWNERTNQTASVSDLNTNIDSGRIMPKGPEKTQDELEAELNEVFEQCEFIRKDIQTLTSSMFAANKSGNTVLVDQCKTQLASKRAMLDFCKDRETKIMFQIERLMMNGAGE
jgi:hypothetical protein